MYNRVYRYNKPEAAVLLDILNFSNRANFKPDQLVFTNPRALTHTRTRVTIGATDIVDWRDTVDVDYDRHDLGTTFRTNPLVIDVDDVDDQTLLDGILAQFKVLFEAEKVEILRTPLSSALTNNILDGVDYVEGEDPSDGMLGEPANGVYNFTLRARPDSLIWVGETSLLVRRTAQLINRSIATLLGVRQYLESTRDNKVPIELIYDVQRDASEFGRVMSEDLVTGDLITDVSSFLNIARRLTGDSWIAVNDPADFNLMSSKVLYNGHNVGTFATHDRRYSHILVVRLGELCLNLKGTWTIQYNDPTVFSYNKCRVDRDTPTDL